MHLRDDVVQSLNEMKTGKAPGFSDLLFDLKAASMEVRIQVMLR